MKTFHCTHCQHLVFFENIRCLNCGHALAYLPDRNVMAAVQQGEDRLWRYEGREARTSRTGCAPTMTGRTSAIGRCRRRIRRLFAGPAG